MKKSRYLLKRTKFALFTGVFPLILGFILLVVSCLLVSFSVWSNSLDINTDLLPTANNLPIFYDINGQKIEYKSDNYLSPDEIPNNLKNAFVALEDKRFYQHNGYDTYRIASALTKNISKGKAVEGASTITQQLIKNTHLTFEKTITRKFKEIALATKLEKLYTKDEILSMYLSVIYFGNGAYGVKSASKQYFGKEIQDLTLAECATLAGIIKNPSKYSPKNNIENSMQRRNVVLEIMEKQGYITHSQMEISSNEDMIIADNESQNLSKFFLNKVIDEVCQKLNLTKYQLDNSGLKIYTTYSPELQEILVENSNLTHNFSKNDVANSSLILDNETGFILAYNSTLGYEISRQCGSILKPLVVYAPAIENDVVTLATPIDDNQIKIGDWTPKNYGDRYLGITNVREAIKKSSNTVAVKVASYIGEDVLYKYGKAFGFTLSEKDKNLTLSLGATEKGQTPLQVATAYSTFANSGQLQNSTFVRFIVDNGKKIYSHFANRQRVISKETAFLVSDCLVDTVKDGTARALSSLPFALASKTGTVSNQKGENTDAWSVSFNDKFTLAVWHGDADETGGGHPTKHACNIWKTLDNHMDINGFSRFSKPQNICTLPVDTYSTKKLNRLTLSTDNTPSIYVKYEYFKQSNTVDFETSLFEYCPVDFKIFVDSNVKCVKISFQCQDVFTYQLLRKDILGECLIATVDGKDDLVTVFNSPQLLGLPIEYTLNVFIKGTENIVGSCNKTVIVD